MNQLAYWFVQLYSTETETNTLLRLASFGFPKLVRMNVCRNDRNEEKGCQHINAEEHSEKKVKDGELLVQIGIISHSSCVPVLFSYHGCTSIHWWACWSTEAWLHHSTFWVNAQSDHIDTSASSLKHAYLSHLMVWNGLCTHCFTCILNTLVTPYARQEQTYLNTDGMAPPSPPITSHNHSLLSHLTGSKRQAVVTVTLKRNTESKTLQLGAIYQFTWQLILLSCNIVKCVYCQCLYWTRRICY